jgi:hypothetical protein
VGFIDDLFDGWNRGSQWLNRAAEDARAWAASERGQEVLAGLDFVALSSKLGDYYAHVGWYMPLHPDLQRYMLEHVELHQPFDARAAARCVGPGSEHWAWICEGVRASPSVHSRGPVVDDALFNFEHRRWHAAISTLLPVLEGIISDRSGVLQGMRVGRRFDDLLDHDDELDLLAIAAVPALDVLDSEVFASEDFDGVAIDDTALNRHAILHGRSIGYGTEVTACRVLMLLVGLIELLDGPLILRVDAPSADAGSYLDDFGPLAGLRRAVLAN